MEPPEEELVTRLIVDAVAANKTACPPAPGSMYVRPTLLGTMKHIGAAGSPSDEAILYVLCCPGGDYFAGGIRPLSIFVETELPRTIPQFGTVKCGANYATALGPTVEAKKKYGVDQVVFVSGDGLTETGAANFFLVDDTRLITRDLDGSFLHGVTRASLLTIANDLGYRIEERPIELKELAAVAPKCEAFLSGTAAGVVPVGSVWLAGKQVEFGDGKAGANTLRLRAALTDIQFGRAADEHDWRTTVAC